MVTGNIKTTIAILAVLIVCSCGPKNEEVTTEQIEVGAKSEVLDSIADTRKDAVKTDENEITPTLPLPQPVIELLSQKYPGYQQPALTPDTEQTAKNYQQGPFIVRGNFNTDAQQDYALQLQQGKDVVIVAILQDSTSNWSTHELKRDILFNNRGTLQSMYVLHLLEKGRELQTKEPPSDTFKTPVDAIGISSGGSTTAYVLQNGTFKSYMLAEDED